MINITYTKRKSLKITSMVRFYKRDPRKTPLLDFVWKCHLHGSTYPPWTETQLSSATVTVFAGYAAPTLKRRWSGLWAAEVGPLPADTIAAQTFYSRMQPVQQVRNVGIMSTSQRCHKPKRKSWAACSPPPSPRQETENRCPQWSVLLLATSPLLAFTAKEQRGWKKNNIKERYFFHLPQQKATCSKTRTLEVRQDR